MYCCQYPLGQYSETRSLEAEGMQNRIVIVYLIQFTKEKAEKEGAFARN